jgi:ABC-type branched-subunit amino acid transport system substrate-binding protein
VACLAGCGGSGAGEAETVPIVVSAPVSTEPWIARSIQQGAQLAVDDINAKGGVVIGTATKRLRLDVRDNAGSPANALADARQAVADHAAVLLSDGTGATAVASVTDPAHLPVFVLFEGGAGIIDPARWPTLFRLAPANATLIRRLADYIANAKPKVAMLTDDSDYGQQGRASLREAFKIDAVRVVCDATIQRRAADVTPQVLAARKAGADRLVLWTTAANIAAVVQATHQAGWDVPILTGQTGEDPLLRQRLASHPEWLDSVRFASSRITAEMGPKPFNAFRAHFEAELGAQKTGVTQDGRPVIQPPDWAMYPYDAMLLLRAALEATHALGRPLLQELNSVSVVGANGDGRGYSPAYHEGVSPQDMYFARFEGFTFVPVTDDPLSESLPKVPQLG